MAHVVSTQVNGTLPAMLCSQSKLGGIAEKAPSLRVGRWALLAACCIATVVPVACGGTIRHDRDDSLYLDLAADSPFDPVGKITWNEPGLSFLASGSLIRDEWVLTAAHVVGGTDGLGAGVSNLKFNVGGSNYTADQWIPHPEWSESNESLTAGWDIGLVHLVTGVGSIEPAELYLPADGSELGAVGIAVGFGATGTGSTGYEEDSSGTKRAGQNVLDVVGTAETSGTPNNVFNNNRLIAVDFDNPGSGFGNNPFGSGTPLELEYLVAPGDSGGGLFIDVEGTMKLAGVTSYIFSTDGETDSDYGDRAAFTRVSQFIEWINETIGPEEPILLLGDYNGNNVVDAADYTVWRDALESGGTLLNDPTPDMVDESDFLFWREHFGESLGAGGAASAAVPEPASLALWLGAVLIAAGVRRR